MLTMADFLMILIIYIIIDYRQWRRTENICIKIISFVAGTTVVAHTSVDLSGL